MDQLKDFLSLIGQFIRTKKLATVKMLAIYMFCTIVFAFVLFPFGDLSNFVTSEVSKATNNSIYLTFSDLNVGIFPSLKLEVREAKLDTATFPRIEVSSLSLRPSFLDLIGSAFSFSNINHPDKEKRVDPLSLVPGVNLDAEGLFNGELSLQLRPEDRGRFLHKLEVTIEGLDLANLNKNKLVPVKIKGLVNANINGIFDLKFKDQPEGEFSLTASNIEIDKFSIPLQDFGALPLPNLKFQKLALSGRLSDKNLIVNNLELGSGKDDFLVALKGQISMALKQSRRGIDIDWGIFEFQTLLDVNKKLMNDLYFLNFLEDYRIERKSGYQSYGIRGSGKDFYGMPNMRKITTLTN